MKNKRIKYTLYIYYYINLYLSEQYLRRSVSRCAMWYVDVIWIDNWKCVLGCISTFPFAAFTGNPLEIVHFVKLHFVNERTPPLHKTFLRRNDLSLDAFQRSRWGSECDARAHINARADTREHIFYSESLCVFPIVINSSRDPSSY